MTNIDITPRTKVASLLKHYPALEEVFIEIAPEFQKLRNPILRNTVAKVTTLEQAAKVAGISLSVLINGLRSAAGVESIEIYDTSVINYNDSVEHKNDDIYETIDARPLLSAGEHPLEHVLQAFDRLPEGKVLELIAPFTPVPLIDIGNNRGFSTEVLKEGEIVKVYFKR